MTTNQFCILAAIAIYLIMVVYIGFKFSKGNSDSADFYLGGRKMGPFVTAMSAEASDMSSYLLMGLPGLAYLCGVCEVGWTVLGLAVGTYLNWLLVAKRLRRYSAKIDAITVPEFFSKRFHDKKNILSAIAAVVIIVFFIPYTASGFAACGKLFNSLSDGNINYTTAMIVSAVIIVTYTVMGGFKAVSTTDFIQSIVMTVALIIVVFFGVSVAGGWDKVWKNAKEIPSYLSFTDTFDPASGSSVSYGGIVNIISTLAWGLGYFGMPHILLRFMAIEDENKLKLSRRIASIWVVIAMAVAVLIGMIGRAMTDKAGAIDYLNDSSKSESIIVKIAELLSQNGVLAAIVAGVILAGILAATMSTADSQMLAAASSVSQNIVGEFFGKKLTDKQNLWFARATILVISIIAVFLALDPNSSVFSIVSFAWAGFGGAFGAVMLLALFWKRANTQGALAGMIGGGATVFIWKFLVRPLGGAFNIYELLPAFIVSMLLMVIVSLVTKEPENSVVEEFNAINAK